MEISIWPPYLYTETSHEPPALRHQIRIPSLAQLLRLFFVSFPCKFARERYFFPLAVTRVTFTALFFFFFQQATRKLLYDCSKKQAWRVCAALLRRVSLGEPGWALRERERCCISHSASEGLLLTPGVAVSVLKQATRRMLIKPSKKTKTASGCYSHFIPNDPKFGRGSGAVQINKRDVV